MGKVSPIPVGNGRENPRTIFAFFERDFSNPRQVLPKFKFILRVWRAKFVIPDLLVKINVFLRPFALVRITSVENSGAVVSPCRAPATGRILDTWDCVSEFFAGFDFKEM